MVLEDADVDLAAHAAVWGAMFNAGQTCVSVERVYVLEPVYDQFVAAVVRDVENLEMGAGDGKHFGAMIDDSQVAVTERQTSADALAKGARALTGGTRGSGAGSFYEPTVLVDVDHSMAAMTEETFGPHAADHEGVLGRGGGAAGQRQPLRTVGRRVLRDLERARKVALQLDCGV